jgi:hypothetical protein
MMHVWLSPPRGEKAEGLEGEVSTRIAQMYRGQVAEWTP